MRLDFDWAEAGVEGVAAGTPETSARSPSSHFESKDGPARFET